MKTPKQLLLKAISALTLKFVLTGCLGGGGSVTRDIDRAVAQNRAQSELAIAFVRNLNGAGEVSAELVEGVSFQQNYIVIRNAQTQEFVAINISGYTNGSDASAFYRNNLNNSSVVIRNLEVLPGFYETRTRFETATQTIVENLYDIDCACYRTVTRTVTETVPVTEQVWVRTRYKDRVSGLIFEKGQVSPKDLEKMAALKEAYLLENQSEHLQVNFGLSAERSQEIAKLTKVWEKAGGKQLSIAEQDAFAHELMGFTFSELIESVQEGNGQSLEQLLEKAAFKNGTSPEHMRQIIESFK